MSRFVALVLAALVLGGGCSSGDDGDAGTTAAPATLAPNPDVVLAASAEAMGNVDTVAFSIERSGAPIYIDPLDVIAFNKAEGRFSAPSSADAVVSVEAAGFNTKIGAIAFGGKTWLSDPVSGNFAPAPGGYAFDPATLFDPDIGWRPLLAGGLTDVEWVGPDTTQDGERYRLRGVADPERLEVITAGLVRNQTVVLDLWLDVSTGEVREVEFDTVYEGATSTWLLTFTDYGEPVEVTPPPADDGD